MRKTQQASEPSKETMRSGPMTTLLDLIGQKWTPRILWELREDLLTFRELRERAGNPSPALLNVRLHELVEAGLVDPSDGEGYTLTPLGSELAEFLQSIAGWSEQWAARRHFHARALVQSRR